MKPVTNLLLKDQDGGEVKINLGLLYWGLDLNRCVLAGLIKEAGLNKTELAYLKMARMGINQRFN